MLLLVVKEAVVSWPHLEQPSPVSGRIVADTHCGSTPQAGLWDGGWTPPQVRPDEFGPDSCRVTLPNTGLQDIHAARRKSHSTMSTGEMAFQLKLQAMHINQLI